MVTRCSWVDERDVLMVQYHDEEWGVTVRDDRLLFELLSLEGAQAGLSWKTILHRREDYRRAFRGFDPGVLATMTDQDLLDVLQRTGIVRHRLKVFSVRNNARIFLEIQKEAGTFSEYCWSFVADVPIMRKKGEMALTRSTASDALSKDLKKRGMTFVGTTIIYAFMQAVGMVNDHDPSCFKKHLG